MDQNSFYVTIAVSISTAILASFVQWWLRYYFGEVKTRKQMKKIHNHGLISDIIYACGNEIDADRALVFQCHNGGKYFSGEGIEKFSATSEWVRDGISEEASNLQNQPISIYSHMFKELLDGCVMIDSSHSAHDTLIKSFFFSRGVQACLYYPITKEKKIIAFYGFEWNNKIKISQEKQNLVAEIGSALEKLL